MSLHFQLNNEIVTRYKQEGLSIEYLGSVLIILFALYEKDYTILDTMDDSNKEKRILTLYQYLHRKNFLEPTSLEDDVLYSLTEKAIDFIKYCESFIVQSSNTIKREDRAVKQEVQEISSEDPSRWIEEWISLFPEGKFDGRYLRTNKHECADRMRWFIREYSYDQDTIIKATKAYINSQETSQTGHAYTRNSSYFIFKGRHKNERTSDLATWCDRVLNENINPRETFQRDVA